MKMCSYSEHMFNFRLGGNDDLLMLDADADDVDADVFLHLRPQSNTSSNWQEARASGELG